MINFSGSKNVMGKTRTIIESSLIFHTAFSMSSLKFLANLIPFKQRILVGRDGIPVGTSLMTSIFQPSISWFPMHQE
jgi:hypothetical protein